ncbi:hypothetical protein CVT25_000054 [Psilocybe cyanescens]|uniref:Uncharacterized protein n=1 Tax=Psilocybe cyanescens TaxID=93625 RepID=A0A409X8P5_PSICY|nr:hypothetical protein CVT25_000054 [Psilocybe cyanescens]
MPHSLQLLSRPFRRIKLKDIGKISTQHLADIAKNQSSPPIIKRIHGDFPEGGPFRHKQRPRLELHTQTKRRRSRNWGMSCGPLYWPPNWPCRRRSRLLRTALFQSNQIATGHDEWDAQMVIGRSVIHPDVLGFWAALPALTRLVDLDPQKNELAHLKLHSEQTSPSPSSEQIPKLMFTPPTEESNLAREHVGEENISALKLLNRHLGPYAQAHHATMPVRGFGR